MMISRLVQGAIVWSVLTLSLACNVPPPATTQRPLAPAPLAAADAALAEQVEQSVQYLASDELEGRGLGTEGIDLAADYIAGHFQRLGLSPPPRQEDHFQRFEVTLGQKAGKQTQLRLGDEPLVAGKDYIPLSFSAEKPFAGRVAYVGYGISSRQHKYDDYAGLEPLDGMVAMAMRYEPHNKRGGSRLVRSGHSSHAALHEKAKTAAKHGASALLIVNPPMHHDDEAQQLIQLEREFPGGKQPIPTLHISQELAQRILGDELSLPSLQEQIDTTRQPQSRVLDGTTISGNVQLEPNRVTTKNVMAYLPGIGARKDEVITVGAHYDHLGLGGRGSLWGSGQIHNGADDNASGTAAVLAMAELLARSGPRARSILFVLFSGEERGLLGSAHFVENPPVPIEKIVAMVNLDMVGRIRSDTLYISGDGTAKQFGPVLQGLELDSPLTLQSIGKGGLGPSDHMSFAVKKIPVLMFFSGLHFDYHRPGDDADKINYAGLMQAVELAARFVDELAVLPQQQYVSAHDSQSMTARGPGQSDVTLGIVPDYASAESTRGVKISGVVPGSPAEAAGLEAGDVIVAAEPMKLESLSDLSMLLSRSKPGDTLRLKVRRGEQELEMLATLAQRKG